MLNVSHISALLFLSLQQGAVVGAAVLQLPTAGQAGALWEHGQQPVGHGATGAAENRGGAVAVGRLGGGAVHRVVEAPHASGPSSGHLPDH